MINIFDQQGKKVYQNTYSTKSGENNLTIPMDNLAKGIYLVAVGQGQEQFVRQIVVFE